MSTDIRSPAPLAGGNRAGIKQADQALDTPPTQQPQPARVDYRTAIGRALRGFEALPDREHARRLTRHFSPGNGRTWSVRQVADRTGIPAAIGMAALMTTGAAGELTACLIELMGRGVQLIIATGAPATLIANGRSLHRFTFWLSDLDSLQPDDMPVRLLQEFATIAATEVVSFTGSISAYGGISVDSRWHLSRLHLARVGVLRKLGRRR
jgi:hypothetical protein